LAPFNLFLHKGTFTEGSAYKLNIILKSHFFFQILKVVLMVEWREDCIKQMVGVDHKQITCTPQEGGLGAL